MSFSQDLVSVIIPTWNRGTLLLRAVESALEQTHTNTEVLVCDDASTDGSIDLLRRSFAEAMEAKKLKIIGSSTCSGGPAAPRNNGLRQAEGNWIAFLDSDDWWAPKKIELQLGAAKAHECYAVGTNATRVDDRGAVIGPFFDVRKLSSGFIYWSNLWKTNRMICSSVLVSKSVIRSLTFSEDKKFKAIEDYLFWLNIAAKTPFYYISEALVYYTDCPTVSIRRFDRLTESEVRERVLGQFLEDQPSSFHRILWRTWTLVLKCGGRYFV
jgi:teichuronic acid biosynthesis glycosyltransferase TuaG